MKNTNSTLKGFSIPVKPDYERFIDNMLRKGRPGRVHFIELFLDVEVQNVIDRRFDITGDLDKSDPDFEFKKHIAIQRFLGYDYCRGNVDGPVLQYHLNLVNDTADKTIQKEDGRNWMDEHQGPISNWDEFEKYSWPDLNNLQTKSLEKMSTLLPDDMCLAYHGAHFCESLTWLMGYEQLCYALYDNRDLVLALCDKIMEIEIARQEIALQFDRVKIMWHSDDMGFKTGLMISPDDMRELILPGHKRLAKISHDAGRVVFLHSCGNKKDIIDDLIDDVRFDALHSFEDTIELVTDAKQSYGERVSLLGGLDVDFLCRAGEEDIRKRVRSTLDICMPGGGYALGTGNSVANYIPIDNYLTMMDEGRLYSG
ncbi:MAG: hypothetical protein KAQ69_02065 [Spirochaetales bacterium]|nr:hypothetical protein [Spirochaetales bacterium]